MVNKRDEQRAKREKAMPEVKRLVKLYGLSVVAGCLSRLRDVDKNRRRLMAMKREVAELERRL
jgi:hypothetical protein